MIPTDDLTFDVAVITADGHRTLHEIPVPNDRSMANDLLQRIIESINWAMDGRSGALKMIFPSVRYNTGHVIRVEMIPSNGIQDETISMQQERAWEFNRPSE